MSERPLEQKTIGILGGASNVATGYYYQFLNEFANQRLQGWDIAETLIAGMNFGNIEAFVRENNWDALEAYLETKVQSLVNGKADVILCVSNTLHKVLELIMERYDTPFIHIADPTAQAIQAQNLNKVALFGTKPVMSMDYIRTRYEEKFGIDIVTPSNSEQDEIDTIIFDELVKNTIKPSSKARYLEIARRLEQEHGAQGLIMGCTEIFLLVQQEDCPDFPIFNTTKLHCAAAINFALTS